VSAFAQDVVSIYSECDFKPYSYCKDGEVKGISVDIFKSIFSKISGYTLEVKKTKWKDALEEMKKGVKSKIKMIGTISYKPKDRPYVIAYTKPFMYQNKVIYCNKKFKKGKNRWPEDFYHLKIAKMTGFSRSKKLEMAVKKGLIEVIEGNARENIFALMDKKVDCYINDEIATRGELLKIKKEFKDKNLSTKKLDEIHKVATLGKKPFYIGFSAAPFPERDDIIKKINLAIGVMRNSNEIEEIVKKNLDIYLHPNKKRKVSVALYNLGQNLVSDKLDKYGAIPQIIASSFRKRGIEVDFKFYDYHYAYLLTKWGKECISVPWSKTKEIQWYFNFSKHIKKTDIYLFYKKDRFPNGVEPDFNPYITGSVHGSYFDQYFKKHILLKYRSYETLNDSISALLSGKIDVIPARKYFFHLYLKRNFYNSKDEIACSKKPVMAIKNYLIFSKRCENSQEMRDEFNKGFESIKESGVLDKILFEFGLDKKVFE
jgi:polar amino acid transport system substrate-binding protein